MKSRSISPGTIELLSRLEKSNSTRGLEMRTILWQIGSSHESAAIPELFLSMIHRDPQEAPLFAEAITRILEHAAPLDILRLDAALRTCSRSPRADALAHRDGIPPWLRNSLLSCHHDGHMRETSLTALSESTGGAELPFILIRLNEWVPQIRSKALHYAEKRIAPSHADQWIHALPILTWLQSCKRNDHRPFVARVMNFLRGEECLNSLVKGLEAPDLKTRRLCFAAALAHPRMDRTQLYSRAFSDRDIYIRIWAARSIRTETDSSLIGAFLPSLVSSPVAAIRRLGLLTAIEKNMGKSCLADALLDRNAAVRETARYGLKAENMDFRKFYTDRIASIPGADCAIRGLGETGRPEDTGIILPYSEDPSPSLRRSALRAIALLDTERNADLFVRALCDEAPGVSREARDVLQRRIARHSAGSFFDILKSSRPLHCRKNALYLIARADKWQSILYMLKAFTLEDMELRGRIEGMLSQWLLRFNKSFAEPDRKTLDEISLALDQCAPLLTHEMAKNLRFLTTRW